MEVPVGGGKGVVGLVWDGDVRGKKSRSYCNTGANRTILERGGESG